MIVLEFFKILYMERREVIKARILSILSLSQVHKRIIDAAICLKRAIYVYVYKGALWIEVHKSAFFLNFFDHKHHNCHKFVTFMTI